MLTRKYMAKVARLTSQVGERRQGFARATGANATGPSRSASKKKTGGRSHSDQNGVVVSVKRIKDPATGEIVKIEYEVN